MSSSSLCSSAGSSRSSSSSSSPSSSCSPSNSCQPQSLYRAAPMRQAEVVYPFEEATGEAEGWVAGAFDGDYCAFDPAILSLNDNLFNELLLAAHVFKVKAVEPEAAPQQHDCRRSSRVASPTPDEDEGNFLLGSRRSSSSVADRHEEDDDCYPSLDQQQQQETADISSFVDMSADAFGLDRQCLVCRVLDAYRREYGFSARWMADYAFLCSKCLAAPPCATVTFVAAFELVYIMDKHFLRDKGATLVSAFGRKILTHEDVQRHFFLHGCFRTDGGVPGRKQDDLVIARPRPGRPVGGRAGPMALGSAKVLYSNYSFLVQTATRAMMSTLSENAIKSFAPGPAFGVQSYAAATATSCRSASKSGGRQQYPPPSSSAAATALPLSPSRARRDGERGGGDEEDYVSCDQFRTPGVIRFYSSGSTTTRQDPIVHPVDRFDGDDDRECCRVAAGGGAADRRIKRKNAECCDAIGNHRRSDAKRPKNGCRGGTGIGALVSESASACASFGASACYGGSSYQSGGGGGSSGVGRTCPTQLAVALAGWKECAKGVECVPTVGRRGDSCVARAVRDDDEYELSLEREEERAATTESYASLFPNCAAGRDAVAAARDKSNKESERTRGYGDLTLLLLAGTWAVPPPGGVSRPGRVDEFVSLASKIRRETVETFWEENRVAFGGSAVARFVRFYEEDAEPDLDLGPIMLTQLKHAQTRNGTSAECLPCNLLIVKDYWCALRRLRRDVIAYSANNVGLFHSVEPVLDEWDEDNKVGVDDGGCFINLMRGAGPEAVYKHLFCDPMCAARVVQTDPKVLFEHPPPSDPDELALHKARLASSNRFEGRVCAGLWALSYAFKTYQVFPPRPTALAAFVKDAGSMLHRHSVSLISLEHTLGAYV